MSLSKPLNILILLLLFLLPWQTRLIYDYGWLNGVYNEYTTLSFYGVEILLWLIVLLTGINFFLEKKITKTMFTKKYIQDNPRRFWSVILFLFFLIIFHNSGQPASAQFLTRLFGGLCLAVVLFNSRIRFYHAVLALWCGGIIQGLLAVQQFLSQRIVGNKWLGMSAQNPYESGVSVVQNMSERWLRAYGSFGSPNALGIYLAVIFILGLIIYFYGINNDWRKAKYFFMRVGVFLGQIIILSGIILSFSRSAWLGVCLGSLFFIFFGFKIQQNKKIFILNLVKSLIIYGLVVGWFFCYLSPLFLSRLSQDNYLEKLSINQRQTQITEAKNIFFSHPFLGVGAGIYTIALAENYSVPSFGFYEPIHNVYFLILAEIGLIGFLFWLFICFTAIKKIATDNLIYLPVIFTLFITGVLDHWLWSMFTGLMFWWVVIGVGFLTKKEKRGKI
jgi:hypothetical protein